MSYTIVVSNDDGPSTATGVTVDDLLPAGFTAVNAATTRGTCTTGADVTCDLGDLFVGASATITVLAQVGPGAATGARVNTATVDADTGDPVPGDNSASARTTVTAEANLGLVKTATAAVAGDPVTYTMTVTNAGPSVARNATVRDDYADAFDFVSASGPAGACTAPAAGAVECPVGDLAVGDSASITVTMDVPPDFGIPPGPQSATDTATTTSDATDADTSDNEAVYRSSTAAQADVSIVKDAPATVNAGGTVTYTLIVANRGPSAAAATVVTDDLPDGLSFESASSPCTEADRTVTCTLGTLAAGSTRTLTVRGTVPPDADPGQLTNTASVDSSTPDPTDSNNSSGATTAVATDAAIKLGKTLLTSPPDPLAPGQVFAFQIDVTNTGPSTARDVSVLDAATVGLAADIQGDIGRDDCEFTDNDLVCRLGDLEPGQTKTYYVVVASLPDEALGTYTNTATASTTTPEADLDDNVDSVDFTLGARRADLGITKTVAPDTLVAGEAFMYTLTPTNGGESTASDTVVTDVLPDGLTPTSAQTSAGSCAITGQRVSCEVGDVVPELFQDFLGGAVTIVITGTVDSDAPVGPITNRATIDSPTPDPGQVPNEASLTTNVVRRAGLSITKLADRPTVPAGGTVGYNLVVTNSGPSTAAGVVVTDALPTSVTLDTSATDARCLPATSPLTCALGSVPAGQSRTVRVVGTLDPDLAAGTLSNSAAVSSTTPDQDDTDNTSMASIDTTRSADVQLVKTVDQSGAAAGSSVTFTLTATNAGPSTARGVVLQDTMPTGLTVESLGDTGPFTCARTTGTVRCEVDRLGPGQAGSVAVTARIQPGAAGGPVANNATVSADTPDPDESNDRATADVDVFVVADVQIVKTVLTADPTIGEPVTFALDVVNRGPQTAPQVTLSDSLVPGVTFVSASVFDGAACPLTRPEDVDVVTCAVGNLAVGQHARALVTVLPGDDVDAVPNGASVGSGALDGLSDDNFDDVTAALAPPIQTPTPTPDPDPDFKPDADSDFEPDIDADGDDRIAEPIGVVGNHAVRPARYVDDPRRAGAVVEWSTGRHRCPDAASADDPGCGVRVDRRDPGAGSSATTGRLAPRLSRRRARVSAASVGDLDQTGTMSVESRHVSEWIDRPADEVYEWVRDPSHLPEWAPGLGTSVEYVGDEWFVEGGMGRVRVAFAAPNAFGVLDHEVWTSTGETFANPMRVVPAGTGSEVVFSVRRVPGATDEEFDRDAGVVRTDLGLLKRLLEHG